jgi:hypothetical protein
MSCQYCGMEAPVSASQNDSSEVLDVRRVYDPKLGNTRGDAKVGDNGFDHGYSEPLVLIIYLRRAPGAHDYYATIAVKEWLTKRDVLRLTDSHGRGHCTEDLFPKAVVSPGIEAVPQGNERRKFFDG